VTDADTAPAAQRLVALVLLLVAGILSLPLAALAFDGEGSENLILPAQLGGMALVGALVGYLLPGLAGTTTTHRRSVWVGVGVGLLFAVLGVLIFFLLLNGFDGA
jgi:hypothetical protein